MVENGHTESDTERIARIRREVERAENAGDPSFVDEYCTEDVIAIPPGQEPNVGREAAKANLRELYANVDVEIEYTSEEIVVGEEFAFDRGSGRTVHTPIDEGEPVKHAGNYLWLYRRNPENEWKQYRVIWNVQSD